MTTSSARIRSLVEKGTLPEEQAQALLDAVNVAAPPRGARLLLDPLMRFSGERLSLVGLVAALVGMSFGHFRVVFDGFLDLHLSQRSVSLLEGAVHTLAAWPIGAAVFWLASLLVARQGRFIDFLGLIGVARVPSVIFALPLVAVAVFRPPPPFDPAQPPQLGLPLLAATLVALAGLGWFLTLAYRGFGTASGLTGARRVSTFVAAVLVAEVVSKVVLVLVYRALGLAV